MIDLIHVENFKSLKDLSLTLDRLTVLVGPNGAGKSSVLQAVRLTSRIKPEQLRALQASSNYLHSIRTTANTLILLSLRERDGDTLTLKINLSDTLKDDDDMFSVSIQGESKNIEVLPLNRNRFDQRESLVSFIDHKSFSSVVYLRLDARELARTSITTDEIPQMRADGGGLASTLAYLKGAEEEVLEQITADLRRVVPGVKRIRTARARVTQQRTEKLTIDNQPLWRPVEETVLGDRFSIEFDDGAIVPADLLSEGTVLALGLITKLHEPQRPRLVLLDDIDRGLHIEAQAKLVQVLRDLLANDPDLQIVCTTHSPYLLDRFTPDEVRVLALDDQRHTCAAPLTAHPEFEQWRYGTQTGELWATLGDAWVARKEEPQP